jgi:hypothetical protein
MAEREISRLRGSLLGANSVPVTQIRFVSSLVGVRLLQVPQFPPVYTVGFTIVFAVPYGIVIV